VDAQFCQFLDCMRWLCCGIWFTLMVSLPPVPPTAAFDAPPRRYLSDEYSTQEPPRNFDGFVLEYVR
jgi:hypothetical protein